MLLTVQVFVSKKINPYHTDSFTSTYFLSSLYETQNEYCQVYRQQLLYEKLIQTSPRFRRTWISRPMIYTKSQKMHLENMCPGERRRSSNTCMWMFIV